MTGSPFTARWSKGAGRGAARTDSLEESGRLVDRPDPRGGRGALRAGGALRRAQRDRGLVGRSQHAQAARLLLFALALLSTGALAEEPHPPRRFAVVVGENAGLAGDDALRYAQSDARRFREVLVEVGGVRPDDATLLEGARAGAVREALAKMAWRLNAEAKKGDALFVYVSAHADETALHLDGTSLPLAELVEAVTRAPVDLAVLVVDACHSGAVTRTKGLKVLDARPVRVEASGLEGRVFISASGADEYARESDELEGSTFTHHWLTGLRGAADVSRDGRVTLDEAYAWAWARTMEATFASRGGVQRPAFKVDLRGQGQLVLTTPGEARGRLVLDVQAPGRWLVVQARTGAVLADVEKPAGPMQLALPIGAYRVRLAGGGGAFERAVTVADVGVSRVAGEDLERGSREHFALKGGPTAAWLVSASASASSGLLASVGIEPGVDVSLRREDPVAEGVDVLGATVAVRSGRSAASGFLNDELDARLAAGHRLELSRLVVVLAVEAGALLVRQHELPVGSSRLGLEGQLGVSVEARLFVVRPVGISARLFGGGVLLSKDLGLAVAPRASAAVGLFVAF